MQIFNVQYCRARFDRSSLCLPRPSLWRSSVGLSYTVGMNIEQIVKYVSPSTTFIVTESDITQKLVNKSFNDQHLEDEDCASTSEILTRFSNERSSSDRSESWDLRREPKRETTVKVAIAVIDPIVAHVKKYWNPPFIPGTVIWSPTNPLVSGVVRQEIVEHQLSRQRRLFLWALNRHSCGKCIFEHCPGLSLILLHRSGLPLRRWCGQAYRQNDEATQDQAQFEAFWQIWP